MISLDEDEILGEFIDNPDKRSKWISTIRYLYLIWLIFIILGIIYILFSNL
jgi:hypothetical protein